jgi:ribosomal protein S18 acetylase RimI-like enzyme
MSSSESAARADPQQEDTSVDAYIRPATAEDAGQLARVHVRSWQAAYQGLMPQEYLDGLDPADRVERWQNILAAVAEAQQSGGPFRGAVVAIAGRPGSDEAICGFALFGPTRDQDEDARRTGEISAIYLMPENWSTGVGRMVMAEAVSQLAGAYDQATLWVLDSNDRARRFYARNGWAEDGAVKVDDTWGFPCSEVRYRRALS